MEIMAKYQRTYSVSLDVTRILLKYVSIQGIDLPKTYQQIELDRSALNDPKGRMPIDKFNVLWEEVTRQSHDPNFGLHFGETAPNFSSGQIVFSMMLSCPNLKEALEVFCRYHALLGNTTVPRWNNDKHQIMFTDEYPSFIGRHYTEAVLAMLSVTLDRLTENRVKPENIFFIHRQPADITEHQRIFGKTPLFEQIHNGLALDSQAPNMPILLANPTLMSTLEQLAHRLLEGDRLLDSWSQRCSEIISKLLLRSKKISLATVAHELSISPRHLQTKLQAEGISYQVLLDNTRKNIALNCLKQGNMTMCEIALLLGLSEQSAFNHAFKRWTGMTPSNYSDKLL